MKKAMLAFLVLVLCAGCSLDTNTNPFVGTWIGHGEQTLADTPSVGQTTVISLEIIITFDEAMAFTLYQGYREAVDDVLTTSIFQEGTGTYEYSHGTMTMSFDPTSDAGLNDDTPSYSFSDDKQTCTIQPTTLGFPLVMQRTE